MVAAVVVVVVVAHAHSEFHRILCFPRHGHLHSITAATDRNEDVPFVLVEWNPVTIQHGMAQIALEAELPRTDVGGEAHPLQGALQTSAVKRVLILRVAAAFVWDQQKRM
jgi:hypothetical protein